MNYKEFVRALYIKEFRARTPEGDTLPMTAGEVEAQYADALLLQAKEIDRLNAIVIKMKKQMYQQDKWGG